MKYTDEQQAIINCQDKALTVNAFAGTGKTSTLVGYATDRPDEKILYLAFNSGVAQQARTRFPANVECRTSHSLAYARCGAQYRNKLGNPKARDILEHIQSTIPNTRMGSDPYFFAQSVLRTINTYFATGSENHFFENDDKQAVINPFTREQLDPDAITKAAASVWKAMQDKTNTSISMPHDGYLKLYQLTKPLLSQYQTIMLDEAQDTNPCVLNFIQSQSTKKILVGDKNQNIYGFRGAINAMQSIGGTQLFLRSSFRFGPSIAAVANSVLQTFCNEQCEIKGLGETSNDVSDICYLHRTNAGLFDRAVELIKKNQRIHFINGVLNYNFELINDTWKLYSGQSGIRDPFIRRFRDFSEFEEYAESVDDREIKSRIKIVNNYTNSIPNLVHKINNSDTPSQHANASLTTAHKSKGLEWDRVVMGEDFPEMVNDSGLPKTSYATEDEPLDESEVNLIYVALTRAKKELVPGQNLRNFIASQNTKQQLSVIY